MIGQQRLIGTIMEMVINETRGVNSFPHFALFVGPAGSGKKTLLREMFKGVYAEDNKIESVRKLIELSYKVSDTTFILTDIDDMSLAAKNALLKVVEECRNNNRFIMTAEDENNVLETIRSRAFVFHMDEYTSDELAKYYGEKYNDAPSMYIISVCETPGEIDALVNAGGNDVYDYVNKVVDNIALVSGANAFKIGEKIALKDEKDKIDLKLFFKTFSACCIDRFKDASNFDVVMYSTGCQITSKYIRDLRIKGINKQMLFDSWLLDIREAWR